ncbi:hypothetical protein GCM10008171_21710 [Methylopila jiangsuensis]|uniref:Glycosyltransferase n=1 Tax=Methylopila jiangsuensis TaxID=586230 RepID=A0A9W6N4A2_9HYPH|nr:glycosyltransferase [Methylopila jiangsuensis]MDR6286737.1 hypothetical protein [Methylopila jiangsuensis]GLK76917.1 hypothetical protein GCM10008171_21710 [Methylopila jiangsuensis]
MAQTARPIKAEARGTRAKAFVRALPPPRRAPEPELALPPELLVLATQGVPLSALTEAQAEARRAGVLPFDALLGMGRHAERDLTVRLAAGLGLAALQPGDLAEAAPIDAETFRSAMTTGVLRLDRPGRPPRLLVAARGVALARLAASRRGRPAGGSPVLLAGPGAFADAAVRLCGAALAARATLGPGVIAPELTVAGAMPEMTPGRRDALLAAAATVSAAAFAFDAVALALSTLAGLLFLALNVFRVAMATGAADDGGQEPARADDRDLPVYTVLVCLAREAAVVPGLLEALERLDYPPAKLDIKLLIERGDDETLGALAERPPRAGIEVLVLPPGGPKTKPRALNAGLMAARGSLLTVFDAEDLPDPDQLRKALAVFRASPPEVGCVQARLAIDNTGDGWLARQFAIEYAALFDVGLPALSAAGMPIPLGGTSNHFRTSVLRSLGGWDAGNVTEDADLGLRLARFGWRTRTVASVTWEESTTRLWPWIKQRTRWMKGYMVTSVVHARSLGGLAARLGPMRLAGALMTVAGVALTALVYPLVMAGLLVDGLTGGWARPSRTALESALFAAHVGNLALGCAAGLACCWLGADKRGEPRLAIDLFTTPLYWLLVGVAAWRALWQIVYGDASRWEKTAHGLSTRRSRPAG